MIKNDRPTPPILNKPGTPANHQVDADRVVSGAVNREQKTSEGTARTFPKPKDMTRFFAIGNFKDRNYPLYAASISTQAKAKGTFMGLDAFIGNVKAAGEDLSSLDRDATLAGIRAGLSLLRMEDQTKALTALGKGATRQVAKWLKEHPPQPA